MLETRMESQNCLHTSRKTHPALKNMANETYDRRNLAADSRLTSCMYTVSLGESSLRPVNLLLLIRPTLVGCLPVTTSSQQLFQQPLKK